MLSCDELKPHQRGWFFYEDFNMANERQDLGHPKQSAKQSLNSYKESLEEFKAKALMNPTADNMLNLVKARHEMMVKSSAFAERFSDILRLHPEYDTLSEIPRSFQAQKVAQTAKKQGLKDKLERVFKNNHYLLFIQGDCEMCNLMARTLDLVPEMSVIHVDMDNRSLYGALNYKDLGLQLNITRTPALAQVSNDRKLIQPIFSGATDLESLMEFIGHVN